MKLKPEKERYYLILEYDYVTWKPRIHKKNFNFSRWYSFDKNMTPYGILLAVVAGAGRQSTLKNSCWYNFVKETDEDQPIDLMPAEEVADEEIEVEDDENRGNAEEEVNNDEAEENENRGNSEEELNNSEAEDNENKASADEEANNNEAEEVQEEEIEGNKEAKEKESEQVSVLK